MQNIMQLERHLDKVLQSLLEHLALQHIPLAPPETKHRLTPRHDVRNSRCRFNIGEPFVPSVYFPREHGPIDGSSVEGTVDHESGVGEDGYFDDECDFAIGEGTDSHSVEGDGEFGFGAYFAEIGIDEDASGDVFVGCLVLVGGGGSVFES